MQEGEERIELEAPDKVAEEHKQIMQLLTEAAVNPNLTEPQAQILTVLAKYIDNTRTDYLNAAGMYAFRTLMSRSQENSSDVLSQIKKINRKPWEDN